MDNNVNYNRYEIDEKYSMGENGFLYYNNILKKKTYNNIILSSILNLHKKKYLKIEKNEKNTLEIRILSNTSPLKKSELFIFECLKRIDKNKNGLITLNELTASNNLVFAKNKKNIKELIYDELLDDGLIDKEKYNIKRNYLFKAFAALIVSPIIIIFLFYFLFIFFIPLLFAAQLTNDDLRKLKNSLTNSDIMRYTSKNNFKNIIKNIFPYIILFFVNFIYMYFLYRLIPDENISIIIIQIESLLLFIIAIICFIKFIKTNFLTDKAIDLKNKLQELALFLKDYSLIVERQSLEIYLWDTYLILSVLLNINKVIPKEFKINLAKKREIFFDFYENKYYYINRKNEIVYIDKIKEYY